LSKSINSNLKSSTKSEAKAVEPKSPKPAEPQSAKKLAGINKAQKAKINADQLDYTVTAKSKPSPLKLNSKAAVKKEDPEPIAHTAKYVAAAK